MILTTTPTVEGRTISEYMRVIGGETVIGINLYRSMSAGYNRPVEIAQARDFVAVQGIVALLAVIVAVTNFVVDIVAALIDPRVRY